MPNKELLRQTMDHILGHQEQWNQMVWAAKGECGTSYCFAGWTCVLTGQQMRFEPHGYEHPLPGRLGKFAYFADKVDSTGELVTEVARKALGLDGNQARKLFAPNNELAHLKDIVDELCAAEEIV